jgi:hypothetical protein
MALTRDSGGRTPSGFTTGGAAGMRPLPFTTGFTNGLVATTPFPLFTGRAAGFAEIGAIFPTTALTIGFPMGALATGLIAGFAAGFATAFTGFTAFFTTGLAALFAAFFGAVRFALGADLPDFDLAGLGRTGRLERVVAM